MSKLTKNNNTESLDISSNVKKTNNLKSSTKKTKIGNGLLEIVEEKTDNGKKFYIVTGSYRLTEARDSFEEAREDAFGTETNYELICSLAHIIAESLIYEKIHAFQGQLNEINEKLNK